MERQFNKYFKSVGLFYVLLAIIITLSYTTCSCNSVKTALNLHRSKKDSSSVVDTFSNHLHKQESKSIHHKQKDYSVISVTTPKDDSKCDDSLKQINNKKKESYTVKIGRKKFEVPPGSTIQINKGKVKEDSEQVNNILDSNENKGHTETNLKQTDKDKDKNKQSTRVSFLTFPTIIISCAIFTIIMVVVFYVSKKLKIHSHDRSSESLEYNDHLGR